MNKDFSIIVSVIGIIGASLTMGHPTQIFDSLGKGIPCNAVHNPGTQQ